VEVFHHFSRLVEQALHAALQPNNSLCFLARVAPGVHGSDELGSIGSAKVLLENNRVSDHKTDAQGNIEVCELATRDAEKLVDLRFDGRVCMLPRQHLDLVPCAASVWVVHRKRFAHEVAISSPGNSNKASMHTLGFHSRAFRAER
jgi:hypothetical protein